MKYLGIFGIIGFLLTIVLIAFSATKLTESFSSKENIKAPIIQAENVKEKADLVEIKTKLNLYFQENGVYPSSLNQIDNYGLGSTTFQYTACSETKVSIKTNSSQLILDNGSETSGQNC